MLASAAKARLALGMEHTVAPQTSDMSDGELIGFGRALRLVGDQWNLLVLREALSGTRRFSEFKNQLGISDAVLSGRLADLVDQGVLVTTEYSKRPPRAEYLLSERGLDLWSTFVAFWVWEARWARTGDSSSTLVHTACGHQVSPLFACGSCGRTEVSARDAAAVLQPNATISRAGRDYSYRRSSVGATGDSTHLHSELLSLLGDRWSIVILSAALLGLRRFGELQQALGVSPIVLTARLSEFVDNGVMERVPVAPGARRHEYRLLEKGLDLMPLLALTNDWGSRWFADPGGDALSVMHRACAEPLNARWVCDKCDIPLERDTIRYEMQGDHSAPDQAQLAGDQNDPVQPASGSDPV